MRIVKRIIYVCRYSTYIVSQDNNKYCIEKEKRRAGYCNRASSIHNQSVHADRGRAVAKRTNAVKIGGRMC